MSATNEEGFDSIKMAYLGFMEMEPGLSCFLATVPMKIRLGLVDGTERSMIEEIVKPAPVVVDNTLYISHLMTFSDGLEIDLTNSVKIADIESLDHLRTVLEFTDWPALVKEVFDGRV